MQKLFFVLCSFILTFTFSWSGVFAKSDIKINKKLPVELVADEINYDKVNKTLSASGNVEIEQSGNKLFADEVKYDQKSTIINSSGDVKIIANDGMVIRAKDVTIDDKLISGTMHDTVMEFQDNSTISAKEAIKDNENTIMKNSNYTACRTECLNKKGKIVPPLWSVSAKETKISQKKETIIHKNIFFNVYDQPVLYFPYLSHPTPNATRKTGFLVPKYSTDQIFGLRVDTPYYINIAENKDMTLTPIITTKENGILAGQYRQLIKSGAFNLGGSITKANNSTDGNKVVNEKDTRSHLEGDGNFTINPNWQWGFTGKRASDDTYLKRYKFGYEDTLTSKIYSRYNQGSNYGSVEAISFQGLLEGDDPKTIPTILPKADYHFEKHISNNGLKTAFDGNLLAMTREIGSRYNRSSGTLSLIQPYFADHGSVIKASTSLRQDVYYINNYDKIEPDKNKDGFVHRTIPQVNVNWSLPLSRPDEKRNIIIEPMVQMTASPNDNKNNKIPNEDSQDIEFSDENLFNTNHFSGYDLTESGGRASYGIRSHIDDYKYGNLSLIAGQILRIREEENFGNDSGLKEKNSDFVGRISYNPNSKYSINYKFRLDNNSLSLLKNSVSFSFDNQPLKLGLDYTALNDSFFDGSQISEKREFAKISSNLEVTKEIELSAYAHRDIQNNRGIEYNSGLLYKADCAKFLFSWNKKFTYDRDIRPNTTFSLQILLKNFNY